jgi:hypothetical protein
MSGAGGKGFLLAAIAAKNMSRAHPGQQSTGNWACETCHVTWSGRSECWVCGKESTLTALNYTVRESLKVR